MTILSYHLSAEANAAHFNNWNKTKIQTFLFQNIND